MTPATINAAMLRDKDRFKPNPLGDGYLTRAERWFEVLRHAKTLGQCDCCGRRGPLRHYDSYATGETFACRNGCKD